MSMKQLLDDYCATAARLRLRRDRLVRELQAGTIPNRNEVRRRIRLLDEMVLDAKITAYAIERYLTLDVEGYTDGRRFNLAP